MLKFTINRKTWVRGRPDDSALLNEYGKCCLGFYCNARGFTDDEITGYHMPIALHKRERAGGFSTGGLMENAPVTMPLFSSRSFAPLGIAGPQTIMAAINDASDIDDATREAWLTEGFRVLAHAEVTFEG